MKQVLNTSRSLRTGRKIRQGFAGKNKRYARDRIKSITDLRTFFYEYSLFVGDLRSIPGGPNIGGSTRQLFLKAGRIMGDAKAIGNTLQKLSDGLDRGDFETAGERFFRRFGGRTTGRVLQSVPGQNIFARAARSTLGANMQKEFDSFTKQLFRSTTPGVSKPFIRTYGKVDFSGLSHNKKLQKVIETVTDDIIRQAYPLTPVKSGRLRASLDSEMVYEKVKGGSIPTGLAKIGGPDIPYARKIEYGEGKGFNVGAAHVMAYFPNIPPAAQQLRTSSTNRRAVNAGTGKGAMMRRGAVNAINRLKASGLGRVRKVKEVK